MKYDVFISYRWKSSIHQADALESKLKLKRKGIRVYLDREENRGEDWKKKMNESIRESCNFVMLISNGCFPHDGSTDYFLHEVSLALRLGINVIPVYYDGLEFKDIKQYLTEIDDFNNRFHIVYNNNNTDGSVDQIIKSLKTEEEVLGKRYESVSRQKVTLRQELMLLRGDNPDPKCPVCSSSYTEEMSYCHTCGYKFFDNLEISVATSSEKIDERGRLKKHRDLWQKCQSGENNAGLSQALEEARGKLKAAEKERVEREKQLKTQLSEKEKELNQLKEQLAAAKEATKVTSLGDESLEFHLDDDVSFKMIRVEGGRFKMGSPDGDSEADEDEKPQHWVKLDNYYIGETVVTQAVWKAVMKGNPSHFKGDPNLPVECVAWDHDNKNVSVQEFIRRLNDYLDKKGLLPQGSLFRLPTEAEWEYAARGGQNERGCKYSGSDNIAKVAWYDENSKYKTHPVKGLDPNELGLYDMSGNVWEWCLDKWSDKYGESEERNPQGPSKGSSRVLRGGGWYSSAGYCRVACRYYGGPSSRHIGFRLVLVHQ